MRVRPRRSALATLLRRATEALAAVALTALVFLVLPLIESIGDRERTDTIVRAAEVAEAPPPPEAPPPEPEPEQQPQDKPPELQEEAPPLDLAQLEMALNPGTGLGASTGDYTIRLDTLVTSATNNADALFSIADLDQAPRVLANPGPMLTAELRRKAPGTVHVVFIVDQSGRVQEPVVQRASDPVFERPALAAVRQWRFEPGKRAGQPVRFRMRVPFTFPKN